MFDTIRNAWKIVDLRKKLIYTFIMLIIFRLGSTIPVPLINPEMLEQMFTGDNTMFGFIVAIPALERLQKEGEEGRKKIGQFMRYGTVVLAIIQAVGLYFLLKSSNAITNPGWQSAIVIITTFTAGTAFLMWLGEQITEKGVGNGISLIIFAGIVSRIPDMAKTLYASVESGALNWLMVAVILVFALLIIAFVVMMNEAERRLPVQYAKRVVGRKMYGGQSTHIPIKVAGAGVIPIIFAMSIMAFPGTIASFFGKTAQSGGFWGAFLWVFSGQSWIYAVLYFLLIIFFTYFYTAIQFNPIEMSNNMKKNGGFIPGIRPGRPTSDYISRVLSRVTLAGAFFLAFIAVIPIFMNLGLHISNFSIGGTSLLIVVGVALETVQNMESQMLMRHYKGFLE